MKNILTLLIIILFCSCSDDDSGDNGDVGTNNNISPNAPTLVTPGNGSTIITQFADEEIYFEWNPSYDPDNDVVSYYIEVAYDSNFNSISSQLYSSVTHKSIYLDPNQTYHWRVKSKDSNFNISPFSQTWSFYLEDGLAPTIPQLIFPLDETECSNNDLTFSWNESSSSSGNTITYTLYISTTPDFSNGVDIYNTINTEYNITLPQSTAIYWKVEANNGTNSSFSEARSLYTQGNGTTNTMPQLEYVYPENGVTITNQSPQLQWQTSDIETSNNNLTYKVYFSELGQELQLVDEGYAINTYTANGLNFNTIYQWSVWVTDEDGATNVGEIYTFNVN
jgi:hypothetical protein